MGSANMSQLSIELSPELEAYLQRRLESGKYRDASHLVAELLEDDRSREYPEDAHQREAWRQLVSEAESQIEKGEFSDWQDVKLRLRAGLQVNE
jgi:predicted transcriptional regulator